MKKLFLSIALATVGFVAMNAQQQQQQPACCGAAHGNCTATQQCCSHKPNKPQKPNALEGITLTAEQQKSVDELNKKYAEKMKDARKAENENKANQQEQARESKKAYIEEMKNILTPEQYTVYLENMAINAGQGPKHQKPQVNKRDGKRDNRKPARKPNKPVKPQTQEAK